MEYAASPFEIKQIGDSGHIEGLLAGFSDVDHGGDQLLPGCLTKSPRVAHGAAADAAPPRHSTSPSARGGNGASGRTGLYVKGGLTLASRDAQEAHALAKDGALTGLSIGWHAQARRPSTATAPGWSPRPSCSKAASSPCR